MKRKTGAELRSEAILDALKMHSLRLKQDQQVAESLISKGLASIAYLVKKIGGEAIGFSKSFKFVDSY